MSDIGTALPDRDEGQTFLLSCLVNGASVDVELEFATSLAQFLRDELRLTGTKMSCEEQICGACTVLIDDLPVSSCVCLAYEARGRAVTTIEGVATADGLHPLQQAFLDKFALQCGFCTPGIVMSALALLKADPDADRPAIVEHMDGNICRCTGYLPILEAIEQAQLEMKRSDG